MILRKASPLTWWWQNPDWIRKGVGGRNVQAAKEFLCQQKRRETVVEGLSGIERNFYFFFKLRSGKQ